MLQIAPETTAAAPWSVSSFLPLKRHPEPHLHICGCRRRRSDPLAKCGSGLVPPIQHFYWFRGFSWAHSPWDERDDNIHFILKNEITISSLLAEHPRAVAGDIVSGYRLFPSHQCDSISPHLPPPVTDQFIANNALQTERKTISLHRRGGGRGVGGCSTIREFESF